MFIDILLIEEPASGLERDSTCFDHPGREGDISGDDQLTSTATLCDIVICDIGTTGNLHRIGEGCF